MKKLIKKIALIFALINVFILSILSIFNSLELLKNNQTSIALQRVSKSPEQLVAFEEYKSFVDRLNDYLISSKGKNTLEYYIYKKVLDEIKRPKNKSESLNSLRNLIAMYEGLFFISNKPFRYKQDWSVIEKMFLNLFKKNDGTNLIPNAWDTNKDILKFLEDNKIFQKFNDNLFLLLNKHTAINNSIKAFVEEHYKKFFKINKVNNPNSFYIPEEIFKKLLIDLLGEKHQNFSTFLEEEKTKKLKDKEIFDEYLKKVNRKKFFKTLVNLKLESLDKKFQDLIQKIDDNYFNSTSEKLSKENRVLSPWLTEEFKNSNIERKRFLIKHSVRAMIVKGQNKNSNNFNEIETIFKNIIDFSKIDFWSSSNDFIKFKITKSNIVDANPLIPITTFSPWSYWEIGTKFSIELNKNKYKELDPFNIWKISNEEHTSKNINIIKLPISKEYKLDNTKKDLKQLYGEIKKLEFKESNSNNQSIFIEDNNAFDLKYDEFIRTNILFRSKSDIWNQINFDYNNGFSLNYEKLGFFWNLNLSDYEIKNKQFIQMDIKKLPNGTIVRKLAIKLKFNFRPFFSDDSYLEEFIRNHLDNTSPWYVIYENHQPALSKDSLIDKAKKYYEKKMGEAKLDIVNFDKNKIISLNSQFEKLYQQFKNTLNNQPKDKWSKNYQEYQTKIDLLYLNIKNQNYSISKEIMEKLIKIFGKSIPDHVIDLGRLNPKLLELILKYPDNAKVILNILKNNNIKNQFVKLSISDVEKIINNLQKVEKNYNYVFLGLGISFGLITILLIISLLIFLNINIKAKRVNYKSKTTIVKMNSIKNNIVVIVLSIFGTLITTIIMFLLF